MGLRKLGFFILSVLFFQLHLLPIHTISHENPLLAGIDDQGNAHKLRQEKLIVNRRGGGGHGGFGGHIGSGGAHSMGGDSQGHGKGDKSPNTQGGALIPLYAAGGSSHHRNDRHHHGSNIASRSHNCLTRVLFTALMSFAFVYFR